MSDPRSFQKLRPVAGYLEKFSTACHLLEFYHNLAVSAYYSKPKSSYPLEALVYRALATVIARHPVLSAITVDDHKKPYFVRLPRIDLRHAVKFVIRAKEYDDHDGNTDEELDQILQEEHNLNFKEGYGERPFWRLIILHGTDSSTHFVACFVLHHVLGDGKSGLAIHRSFLEALSAIPDSTEPDLEADPIVYPPQKDLLQTLERMHPLPVSIPYVLRSLWNDWFPRVPRTCWTGGRVSTAPSTRTRNHSVTLPHGTTLGLLSAARANKTTLTATFETLLAASVLAHLPEHYSSLRSLCPISLRPLLPSTLVDDDSIGCWVSRVENKHRRPADSSANSKAMDLFSWDDARRVRATIEAEVKKNGKNTPVGLLPFAGNLNRWFKRKVGKCREDSFTVSNIGVFKPAGQPSSPEGGEPWKISRMVFSQSAEVTGPPFEVSLVTGGDGRLTMGFCWLEGVVEEEWMEKVIEELRNTIEEVAQ
ncbi:hypothetical protein VTN00DRAFT_1897 [Thermoascus crustaceus]|uniref:uncharacterized protein n=1 Tax=Thermoascus crustaceus TaxID=5088 RepID=UPI003743606C